MNRNKRRLRIYVLWIADLVVTIAAYGISLIISYGPFGHYSLAQRYVFLVMALVSTGISLLFSLNTNYMGRTWPDELGAVIVHNFILEICVIVFFFLMHSSTDISRLTFGRFLLINIIAMFAERMTLKEIARHVYGRDQFRKKMLIITDEQNHDSVLNNFETGYTFIIVGVLVADKDKLTGTLDGREVCADSGAIPKDIVTAAFDDVFICAPSIPRETIFNIVTSFAGMGPHVHVTIDLPEAIGQKAELNDFGNNYLCVSYSEHVFSETGLLIKRIIDIIGALVGLILTGILFVFLAPAIKIDSKGPIFFSQIRVGRNGKRFKLYKFRSMCVDAEEKKKALKDKNQMDGPMFKMDDDPRVTKVGKFIRRTSLDEFPQFWNVLKGDMSLVGTRPPTEKEFLQYDERYRARLTLRPGLTGLWQVSGRSDITNFDEVVKLDMNYIDNWSLSRDFKILMKTVGILFSGRGAK